MTILIIDNYDSFTYNLYQQVGRISGKAPIVCRNDAVTLDAVREMAPDHIIISPGPGHPDNERDFGVCREVITQLSQQTPTLGVCLGHQGIIAHLGGAVISAPTIVHGKIDEVKHDGANLFRGLETPLKVMRYHSLMGERSSLPESLSISAETEDGIIMAVAHQEWPLFGLQFHPESIGTPLGDHLIRNFVAL